MGWLRSPELKKLVYIYLVQAPASSTPQRDTRKLEIGH